MVNVILTDGVSARVRVTDRVMVTVSDSARLRVSFRVEVGLGLG